MNTDLSYVVQFELEAEAIAQEGLFLQKFQLIWKFNKENFSSLTGKLASSAKCTKQGSLKKGRADKVH